MKKILLIARTKGEKATKKFEDFVVKIQAKLSDECAVENADISELFFEVGEFGAKIYHPEKKFDLKDFDLVVIRNIGTFAVEASAIAFYCRKNGVKFADSYLGRLLLDNKIATEFLLASSGFKNIPHSLYGPKKELKRRFLELGWQKAILKDDAGTKGRLNFLIDSAQEIERILRENPETKFILQEFIPNDSDLRVLVFNGKISLIIRRSRDENSASHLNNTSQGARAEIIPINKINSADLDIAIQAAKITQLEVAGVDLVKNSENGKFYLLEVNNAPQISSGTFQDDKVEKYGEFLREMLK